MKLAPFCGYTLPNIGDILEYADLTVATQDGDDPPMLAYFLTLWRRAGFPTKRMMTTQGKVLLLVTSALWRRSEPTRIDIPVLKVMPNFPCHSAVGMLAFIHGGVAKCVSEMKSDNADTRITC